MPEIDITCKFRDYDSIVCHTDNLSAVGFKKDNYIAKMGYVF